MPTMENKLSPATLATEILAPRRPPRKARLTETDAVPVREVEIVTAEELRHESQVKRKAKPPTDCFVSSSSATDRRVVGVEIDSEVLFGFLSAAEKAIPSTKALPFLSNVRLGYEPDSDRMTVEAASTSLWTAVAVGVAKPGGAGFSAIVPARRARSAANAMRQNFKTVPVGVSDGRFWIGKHCMPQTADQAIFPSRPLIRAWEARAVVPAFYFEEICNRVMAATSKDPTRPGLHGVLFDFSLDANRTVVCTAVGTDGVRLHILELPQMKVQPRGSVLPPGIVVGEQFFRYLRTVANREWTAIEISETQIVARGADYQAVADATMKGATGTQGLENWRSVNAGHRGHWSVDRLELERVLKKLDGGEGDTRIELAVDVLRDELSITSAGPSGRRFKESIGARRFDGPASVNVAIDASFLLTAVLACKSGLIRLGFAPTKDQATSPVTIRGEDEQFKAIVMPIG